MQSETQVLFAAFSLKHTHIVAVTEKKTLLFYDNMSEHFFLLVSGVESHATQPIDRRSTHPGKTAVRAGVERGQVQTVPDPQGVHGEKDNGTGKTFAIPTNDGTGQTFGIPGRSLRQADQERVAHSLHLGRPWLGGSTASIRKRRSSDQG